MNNTELRELLIVTENHDVMADIGRKIGGEAGSLQ